MFKNASNAWYFKDFIKNGVKEGNPCWEVQAFFNHECKKCKFYFNGKQCTYSRILTADVLKLK